MKILAFAATNSSTSINRALVGFATERLQHLSDTDLEISFLDLSSFEMPIYSVDCQNSDGIPHAAHAFLAHIGKTDAVIVSFAEHNGGVTAAWKNIFDWMSRIQMNIWQNKPLAMLSATPSSRAGAAVLASQEMIAPFFGADLRGKLGIGNWPDKWNADAHTLIAEEDIRALDRLLNRLLPQPKSEG